MLRPIKIVNGNSEKLRGLVIYTESHTVYLRNYDGRLAVVLTHCG